MPAIIHKKLYPWETLKKKIELKILLIYYLKKKVTFNRKLFEKQRKKYLEAIGKSNKLRVYSQKFNEIATDLSYVYQWDWLGEPILQSPSDMIVIQEKIFEIKPDIIVETGVAWGGSILFYATILDSINKGKVIGIDLNLDKKIVNKLKNKKFSKRIELIKNNSLSKDIDKKLKNEFKKKKKNYGYFRFTSYTPTCFR
ncbi:MAG: hypothetical protein CMJ09_00525 [Pelagibacterales bacterium]|nr:hypothetical protein [Pelagibacterales bacterium]